MSKIINKLFLAGTLTLAASSSWGQLDMRGLLSGSLNLPVLSELSGLGLPPLALDILDGNLQAVPVAALLVQPQFAGALLQEPQDTLGTVSGLGTSLAGFAVPAFGLLLEQPAALPGYFLSGGALFGDAVVLIPKIPLLNAPLPL